MTTTTKKTLVVIFLLVFTVTSSSWAEVVLIRSGKTKGQGWLFGSPRDASCWVAVPRHVVESSKKGEVAEFLWTDVKGHEGKGVETVVPDVHIDLVFAKALGREKQSCLSRLGVIDQTSKIKRQPKVEAMMMQENFTAPLKMEIRDFDEKRVVFYPLGETAKQQMLKGLSGAPLVLRNQANNEDIPIALAYQVAVNESRGYADKGYAIRFDLIRKLFLNIDKNKMDTGNTTDRETEAYAFQLINSTAVSRNADSGMNNILVDDGHWVAAPQTDHQSFKVELHPVGEQGTFSGLQIHFDSPTGELPDGIILEIQRGKLWTSFAECNLTTEEATCVTAKRKLANLRLTIIKRDGGEVTIAKITLLP